eukprot:CAMPEP_0118922760 /NCGR_PEP_ID=MMETSP1169-20130426/1577_1 /TAXON_ID=36882 /ORGANISM="Pyramimonas obovata, Strain CCMP722" /LENGTH=84 /DNA_ID=CAMNT_0006863683 /DNA_START=530 /DNA_END=784 /DNA_ORIENTATION=-
MCLYTVTQPAALPSSCKYAHMVRAARPVLARLTAARLQSIINKAGLVAHLEDRTDTDSVPDCYTALAVRASESARQSLQSVLAI